MGRIKGATNFLPSKNSPVSTPRIRAFLAKLGLKTTSYMAWNGCSSVGHHTLKCFFKNNPSWSLKKWAILITENQDVIKQL